MRWPSFVNWSENMASTLARLRILAPSSSPPRKRARSNRSQDRADPCRPAPPKWSEPLVGQCSASLNGSEGSDSFAYAM